MGDAAVLLHENGDGTHRKEVCGGFSLTTNNRMELMAAIVALEALTQPCEVHLLSDSEYLVKSISLGWIHRWKARDWMAKPGKPRVNADLWQRLLALCEKHDVNMQWVGGHNGNLENERCDYLAESTVRDPGLPPDPCFVDR